MKDTRFAKFLLFINGLVPLTLLCWDGYHHALGANPANFAIRTTGILTLVFLSLTLLVTPVRKITGWNWLIFSRRTFGLFAFFYASAHFLLFFGLDRAWSVSSTIAEMIKRKYLFVGITGLLLMVPLAITSTNAMIKRLGSARWAALHRLVYLAAIAGVVHYYMLVKADVKQPLAFALVLALLLGYRLSVFSRQRKSTVRGKVMESTVKQGPWSGQLRVVRMVQETPDVRTFRLALPDGSALPFNARPGQYLALSLTIDGKPVKRTYTIASSPTQRDYCELTIKREEKGLASRHLHDTTHEGDLLTVSAPFGHFTFDGTGSDSVVLIAGGVGVTPVMSMLRYLADRNWKGDIFFVFSVKTQADIIFRTELEALQKRFANLHLVVTLTRAEGETWTGRTGRIDAKLLTEAIPKLTTRPAYICGPSAMMDPTVQLLKDLGVPANQIKTEAFGSAKKSGSTASAEAKPETVPEKSAKSAVPMVTFTKSAKTVPLKPLVTLLEIGEAAGLNVPYECRSGVCGTCKQKLVTGSVTMDAQDALDDTDKANGMILLCQAHATASVTIDA